MGITNYFIYTYEQNIKKFRKRISKVWTDGGFRFAWDARILKYKEDKKRYYSFSNGFYRYALVYRKYRLQNTEKRRLKACDSKKKCPDYYTVRQHRVGGDLIVLVHRMMISGALTTSKAGKVLGVKAKNVMTLARSR